MSIWTMRAITTHGWCRTGWPSRAAASGCTSSRHTAPHLNPIARLWGLMHEHVTHNKCYATCAQFAAVTLEFLRQKVPENWPQFRDRVTDNFRVISPKEFRVMT